MDETSVKVRLMVSGFFINIRKELCKRNGNEISTMIDNESKKLLLDCVR